MKWIRFILVVVAFSLIISFSMFDSSHTWNKNSDIWLQKYHTYDISSTKICVVSCIGSVQGSKQVLSSQLGQVHFFYHALPSNYSVYTYWPDGEGLQTNCLPIKHQKFMETKTSTSYLGQANFKSLLSNGKLEFRQFFRVLCVLDVKI